MSVHIPQGYNRVMPYLILKDAVAFMDFAMSVFGATEKAKHMNDDGSFMHGELNIGDSVIMVGQSNDDWGVQNAGLYIQVEDADATYNKALDEGASTIMQPEDKDYGRSGGVKDPQGNTWWITSNKPQ